MTDQPIDPHAPPPSPPAGEVSTSRDGRDITIAFIGALRETQDTVLRRLGQNHEVYRELRRDGQVHSTFQQRRLALKSRPLVVEPGGPDARSIAAAEALRENLEQIAFDRASGLMMWGAFYGHSVGECMWGLKDGRVWLEGVKVRTPWRFRYGWDGQLRLITRENLIDGEPMPAGKFWTTAWGADTDDDPYGIGLAHQLYWPVYFKKQGLGFWLRALEKFGAPVAKGTHRPDAPPGDVDKLLNALYRMRMDGAIAVPEGTTVELLEASRGTVDQAAFNRAMNAEISKIVLGQTMTTDDGASLSQSEVHMEVREELTDADAEEICESFMAGPARWLTQWNFPGAATPVIKRPAPEDETRSAQLLAAKAAAVQAMRAAGFEPTDEVTAALFGDGWRARPAPATREDAPPGAPGDAARGDGAPTQPQGAAFAQDDGGPGRDAIDDFVDDLDWAPLMEEPIAFLEGWLAEAGSLEEARDRLPELLASLTVEQLRASIAGSATEARVAGRAGLALSDVEDDEGAF